jgi:hypothetical protein
MIATRLSALVRRAEKVFVAMAPNMAPSDRRVPLGHADQVFSARGSGKADLARLPLADVGTR